MDVIDQKILTHLTVNSRITAAQISKKVHLSLPAITERLRKLNRAGYIDQHTIRINRELFGFKLLAFIKIWLDHQQAAKAKDYLLSIEEVLECHHVAGDYDLLLKVLVKDTAELEQLLVEKIKTNKAIVRTSTTIILDTYKEQINRNISENDL